SRAGRTAAVFFQAEDGIRVFHVTGVQTCALPIYGFLDKLATDDVLLMPEPVYFGGSTDRSVSSGHIIEGVRAGGRTAHALPDRAACGDLLIQLARPGDRIVIMGARDDSLSVFARDLLDRLAG